MGYHVHKDRSTPVKSEMLKAVVEPKNKEEKFAVAIMKDVCLVGHLSKEKTRKYAEIIFYFLQAGNLKLAPWKLLEKQFNQGDGKAMKVLCKLYFSAEDSFIQFLKQKVPKTINIFSYWKLF